MKTAYLDCFSGISGDMFVGALLDAGMPFHVLERAVSSLPLKGYRIESRREQRGSISGTRFLVEIEPSGQPHRDMSHIRKIISAGDLSKTVKDRCISVFEDLARAEGEIHDRPPDRVHFHEVGAADSIIDIVGAAFGLEYLGIGSLFASELPLGSGFVETRHGRIPLPAPATMELLKGIPVYDAGLKWELVTPTGAALLKTLASSFGIMPPMRIEHIGYGVGTRDLPDRPNLLRMIIGRDDRDPDLETVVILEANLDDSNPEWLGFLMDRLLMAEALDVSFFPVHMKKNRPGVLVQVIGRPHQRDTLLDILFEETTTLGVRFRHSMRKVLTRSTEYTESPWGPMKVKKVPRPDGSCLVLPEYEACREIAARTHVPLKEIYYWVNSLNRLEEGKPKVTGTPDAEK